MNTIEQLQKTIVEMTEEQQYKLLQTARQLLVEQTVEEPDNPEYQALLKEFLLKRYEHAKAHPERSSSWNDVKKQTQEKYGWK